MADVFVRRWYSLAAAVLLELLAGLNALFSLYAHELRDNLGYSQLQLQGLGTATVSAGLLAVLPGFLLVYLADLPRLGPRCAVAFAVRTQQQIAASVGTYVIMFCHPDIIDASEKWVLPLLQTVPLLRLRLLCCRLVVWTGIAFSCIGYLLVWAGADGKIAMPFGVMVVLSMLISDGSSWVDTAATTVSLDNFPHHKGYITGEHPPGIVTACRTCSLVHHMLHRA